MLKHLCGGGEDSLMFLFSQKSALLGHISKLLFNGALRYEDSQENGAAWLTEKPVSINFEVLSKKFRSLGIDLDPRLFPSLINDKRLVRIEVPNSGREAFQDLALDLPSSMEKLRDIQRRLQGKIFGTDSLIPILIARLNMIVSRLKDAALAGSTYEGEYGKLIYEKIPERDPLKRVIPYDEALNVLTPLCNTEFRDRLTEWGLPRVS